MSCSITDPGGCLTSLAGTAASSIADSAFKSIAHDFGQAASATVNWLWGQVSAATTLTLSGKAFDLDIAITTAIAVVVATGLFAIQVTVSVLRRDHAGLARAGKGLLVAFLGGGAAIAVVNLLLAATDALSAGIVQAATGGTIDQLGTKLLDGAAIASVTNPAGLLLLALVVIVAVVLVWAMLMIRKLLIIIAAIFAPLAFSGATAEISTSWVRRWIELTVALIVSKVILVIVFIIGLGALTGGLGSTPHPGAGQSVTQIVIGALILLMAGFAPWAAIKIVHFSGDHFAQIHAHAGAATAGAATAVAAPQKLSAITGRIGAGAGSTPGPGAGSGSTASSAQHRQPADSSPGPPASPPGAEAGSAAKNGHGVGAGAGAAGAAVAAGSAAKSAVTAQAEKAATVAAGDGESPPKAPSPPKPRKAN
ncbi:MAG: hypothetical protein ACR2MN_13500 [Acidimicrobiales bacterium]